MAGRGVDEGRRKLPGSGWAEGPPSAPGSTAPGTEIAAMERRKAPAFSMRERGKTEDWVRRSALHPLGFFRGERRRPREWGRDYGVPGAAKNTGAGAWLDETWLFEN
jgi:hypothetical protein